MADAIEYGVFAGGYGPPQYQRQRFAGIKNPEVFTGKDFGIWRRRRDLNPRDGFPPYSLSRGAPSATWVLLHAKYRIHLKKMWRREWDSNPRMLPHRRFSRPVPSTTRTSLHVRSPAKCKKDDTTLFAHCQLPPAIFFCFFPNSALTWSGVQVIKSNKQREPARRKEQMTL